MIKSEFFIEICVLICIIGVLIGIIVYFITKLTCSSYTRTHENLSFDGNCVSGTDYSSSKQCVLASSSGKYVSAKEYVDSPSKKILTYLYKHTYCGKNASLSYTENQGPIFKYNLNKTCTDGSQDFWLNGNMLETILNYTQTTNDDTFLQIILKNTSTTGQLQQMLINGYNGCWNDDRMWWSLSYIRMYEYNNELFDKELLFSSQIFNATYNNSFTLYDCGKDKQYTTTWWQLFGPTNPDNSINTEADPTGLKTYRNAVTNSLFLELSLRLYNISKNMNSDMRSKYELYSKDIYWNVATKLIQFLKTLKLSNGLIADGYKDCNTLTENIYTYTQGVILDAFSKASVIAYEINDKILYKDCIQFVLSLINIMTLEASLNISTNVSCDIHINNRIDCIGKTGGDQEICLSSPSCCYNSDFPAESVPFCYKKINETINPLLTTVNNMSILTEIYNSKAEASGNAFKGIFMRYLAYSIETLHTFFKSHNKEYSDSIKLTLLNAIKFIKNNYNYVLKNSVNKQNGLYSFYWNLSKEQNSYINDDQFSTSSTISVIDLINSYNFVNKLEI
jgi:hypothetical protein